MAPLTIASAFAELAANADYAQLEALLDMKTGESVSYSHLLACVSLCANRLLERSPPPRTTSNRVIMVGIEEGRDLVAIELAAWMLGFAVCPFDVSRDPRVQSIVQRVKPGLIVVGSNDSFPAQIGGVRVIQAGEVLDWSPQSDDVSGGPCLPCNDALAVSHMVFTSGTSTGRPKCVVVNNASLLRYARSKQQRSRIRAGESRVFLASSLVFDPQLGDIAVALTAGATLVLPNRKSCFLGGQFRQALLDSRTTHVTTTPAVLRLGFSLGAASSSSADLLSDMSCLQEVLVGGERMSSDLVKHFLAAAPVALGNTWGTTECTVYQTVKMITALGDESLLGEPYDGVTIKLLRFDSDEEVSKEEVEGEIVLFGELVGLGYLAEDCGDGVVVNPMLGYCGPGKYRTGDVGRWEKTVEGLQIRFLGRRDAQFKVNGVRIEAEEVESQIMSTELCSAVAVVMASQQLVAFCVFKDETGAVVVPKCIQQCMRHMLDQRLPATHIPTRLVAVSGGGGGLPLTPTGKVDRRALLQQLAEDASAAAAVPQEEDGDDKGDVLEQYIRGVWAEVLGISPRMISSWDSFQRLGGDSLQALKTVNKILSRVRDSQEEVVQLANVQSQVFGEIEGPFSAWSLLGTSSLSAYANSLRPFIPATEETAPPAASAAAVLVVVDTTDAHPALSRALMDAARLGLKHTLECLLNLPSGDHQPSSTTLLLSADGRFQPRNFPCKTPLHEAAQAGQLGCVQLLLERGARVMAVTEARISPLHLASTPEIVRRLVAALRAQRPRDCATPMFICDKNDQTALHFAARAGRAGVIQAYIEEQNQYNPELTGKGMNMFDHWRRTPLHWAVVNFHVDCARFLLQHGCLARPAGMRLGQPGPGTHLIQESPLQVAVRRLAPQELIDLLQAAEDKEKEKS